MTYNKIMKFNEILRKLRKENNLELKKVANDLSIPYNTFSRWERGECEPNIETLIRLSDYYHVSIDYLTKGQNTGIYISKEEYEELKCAKKAFDKLASCLNAIEHRQNMLEHTTINANNNKGTIIFGDGNTIKNEK